MRRACVLAPAVRVMDQARARVSGSQSSPQRLHHQLRPHVVSGCPAHNAATEQVEDDGEIQPPGRGPDVGDVRGPQLVGPRRVEILLDQVWRNGLAMVRVRGSSKTSSTGSSESQAGHQSRDTVATKLQTSLLELGVDARAPVGPSALAMDCRDLDPEALVVLRSLRRLPARPCVVATGRYLEHPAQHRDWETGLLLVDEPEPHEFPSRRRPRLFLGSLAPSRVP